MDLNGSCRFTIFDHETGETEEYTVKNLVMDGWKNLVRTAYRGEIANATDLKIKYFAVGVGVGGSPGVAGTPSSFVDSTKTKLDLEVFRKQITSFSNQSGAGLLDSTCYIAPYEANNGAGYIFCEAAWFGGPTAQDWNSGAGKDTGTMVARCQWTPTFTKTASKSCQAIRTDDIG